MENLTWFWACFDIDNMLSGLVVKIESSYNKAVEYRNCTKSGTVFCKLDTVKL